MTLYGAGAIQISAPTGAEKVSVDNGGAVGVFMTAQQIANLGGSGKAAVSTTLSTVGNGTLLAAALIGRLIIRAGVQIANFTDTTDTALAIIAAIPGSVVGASFGVDIENTTAYAETITNGTGVTVSAVAGSAVIPSLMRGQFLVTITSATAVTFVMTSLTSISGTITDAIFNGVAYASSSLSQVSSTVVVNITGLTVNVTGGGTYVLRAHLTGSANALNGLKVAASGTAVMTSSTVTGYSWNGSTINTGATSTTWGSANNIIANTAAYTDAYLEGAFVCQTAGTVTIAAAQNVSGTTAMVVQTGSTLTVFRQS